MYSPAADEAGRNAVTIPYRLAAPGARSALPGRTPGGRIASASMNAGVTGRPILSGETQYKFIL